MRPPPYTLVHPITGVRYYVSDGISEGRWWAAYTRKPNGSMKRLVSPHLPLRENVEDARLDLEAWVAGDSRVRPKGGAK
jgi:hypothetical protein